MDNTKPNTQPKQTNIFSNTLDTEKSVGGDHRLPASFDVQPLDSGWVSWDLHDRGRFNSFIEPLAVRRENINAGTGPNARPCPDRVRVRMHPTHRHSNIEDVVHGAVTLGLIDISLFACAHHLRLAGLGRSVTLALDTQFIGAGRIDEPLDSVVELVRETGRLIFLRGNVVQGAQDTHLVASFSGMIRKSSRRGNHSDNRSEPNSTSLSARDSASGGV